MNQDKIYKVINIKTSSVTIGSVISETEFYIWVYAFSLKIKFNKKSCYSTNYSETYALDII